MSSFDRAACWGLAWLALLPVVSLAAPPATAPVAGLRDNTPTVHALVNARIVVAPGKVLEGATLTLRDGVVLGVGRDVPLPTGATVWDLAGKTIYPGLIDGYAELPAEAQPAPRAGAAGYWNTRVTPEWRVADQYTVDAALYKRLRSQGLTARLVAPSRGIIKGVSALVSTGDDPASRGLLREEVAWHVRPWPSSRSESSGFPNSPMGAVALFRQALYDAEWYERAWTAFRRGDPVPRPEQNLALAALARYRAEKLPVVFEADDVLYTVRSAGWAEEFDLNLVVRASGREYQRLEAVRGLGRPLLVPVDFPKPPDVRSPERALSVSLEELMHWDHAPENPARLAEAGVDVVLVSQGLTDVGTFLAAVRRAVERGLSPDDALAALTTRPAKLWGVSDRLGTLEAGKAASFLVTDGELFAKATKVLETWVDGRRYEVESYPFVDPKGTWSLRLGRADGGNESLELDVAGTFPNYTAKLTRAKETVSLEQVALDGVHLTAAVPADKLGFSGRVRLSITLLDAVAAAPAGGAAAPSLTLLGQLVLADGTELAVTGQQLAEAQSSPGKTDDAPPAESPKAEPAPVAEPSAGDTVGREARAAADTAKGAAAPEAPPGPQPALFPVNYPLGDFGVPGLPEQPETVVFRGATVWTCGPEGTLEGATVLVRRGKIAAVGKQVKVPRDAVVIDARGMHLTPGMIDCHSHIATDGGVNESTQSITAEVRIADFIDSHDVNLYRQLAGGTTTANVLHGSANTIGGQNQVIKFRWGGLPDELKFREAPPGIKFALGENVKQSNWGDGFASRYPQTRMGVEQLLRDAFRSAGEYRRAWDDYRRTKRGLPPRVDLEQEALVEVLSGRRRVHCHSYRQDEILAFLRVCEEFHVRVATLQHILEGYKLADVIAAHGAGASTFSDWWAYKFEVYDAIPYNGALLHARGVTVSFNSDDAELGRRLNTEAAKAVKYGGVSPEDALRFVTLNPARQLGIDRWVGSIEPGKDADLVLWSGSPLSSLSRCEQTWIDGRRYFDRPTDLKLRDEMVRQRAALVARILQSGETPAKPGENRAPMSWARYDEFCHGHDERQREYGAEER